MPRYTTDFRTNSIYGNLAAALRWLAEGHVRVDKLAHVVPPRDAQQAYQNLLHKQSERLTYMFDWTDCP